MKKTYVHTEISKDTLIEALRSITINDINFNSDEWSLWDATSLCYAGELIKREIFAKEKELKKRKKK